jgi:N-acetylglutamate synthase-like GNAT family acetyltransferase
MTARFSIRPNSPEDRTWIRSIMVAHWGAVEVVSRGRIYSGDQLPGFIAHSNGSPVGLITYHIADEQCEIVTINSMVPASGIGSALIARVRQKALAAGCRRLWLITTNDNLPALRFYQRKGFRIAAVYPDAIQESRRLKPSIPMIGMDEIPIRDEIELEMQLG